MQTGGQAAYDVGFGIETDNGRFGCALMSNDASGQAYTYIVANGQKLLRNSPLLVRDLRQYATMKISFQNHILRFLQNDTLIYSAPFAGNVCAATGLYVFFKGSGYVDFIRITDTDNARLAYDENFTSCTSLVSPSACPNPSVLAAAAASKICENDSLIITSTTTPRAASFEWTGPNGFRSTQPNVVIPKTNRSAGGTYFLKATYNACQIINRSVAVQVGALPTVNLGRDTVVCTARNYALDAGANATFAWNDGATTRTRNLQQSGNYAVTVTNSDGCSAADTVRVDVASSFVRATVVPTPPTCFGACNGWIQATADGGFGAPYSYRWAGSTNTTPSVSNLCAGNFILTVTDAKGCRYASAVTLVSPTKVQAAAVAAVKYNGFDLR